MGGPVIVVGASGILAPAVGTLVERGHRVIAVARNEGRLRALAQRAGPACRPCPVDAASAALAPALHDVLGEEPSAGVIAYGPAIDDAAGHVLHLVAAGPVVVVLTSHVATPGHEGPGGPDGEWTPERLPPGPDRRLVLGWTDDEHRWHTPGEVSAAAVALWCDPRGHDVLLGVVRPWAGRPS